MSDSTFKPTPLTVHELGFLDLDLASRPQVISGVAFLDRAVDRSTLRSRLQTLVSANPRLRCVIGEATPRHWIPHQPFSIADHLQELSIASKSEEEILSAVAGFAASGLGHRIPPWRLLVAQGKNSPAGSKCFAICLVAHHSLFDGLEGIRVFSQLFDKALERKSKSTANASDSDLVSESPPLISRPCVASVAAELARPAAKGPLRGACSPDRKVSLRKWSRRSLKAACATYGASLQELLLAVLAESFAAYCRHRNYRRNLRAVLPIGRGITGAKQWNSNRHDIGFVDLPAQAEGFPATLVRVRKSLQALQRDSENQVFPTLKEFLGKFPSGMRTLASRRWSSRAHMLLSFVPIPGAKLTINGALVESVFAIPAVPPSQSIVVGMMAMRNQLCFSLTVDPVVVDLASLQQEIDQTLRKISKPPA